MNELAEEIKNRSDIELAMEYSDLVRELDDLRDEELNLRTDYNADCWDNEQCERNEEILNNIGDLRMKISVYQIEISNRFSNCH